MPIWRDEGCVRVHVYLLPIDGEEGRPASVEGGLGYGGGGTRTPPEWGGLLSPTGRGLAGIICILLRPVALVGWRSRIWVLGEILLLGQSLCGPLPCLSLLWASLL